MNNEFDSQGWAGQQQDAASEQGELNQALQEQGEPPREPWVAIPGRGQCPKCLLVKPRNAALVCQDCF